MPLVQRRGGRGEDEAIQRSAELEERIQSIQQLVDKLPAAALAELFDRIKPDDEQQPPSPAASAGVQGGSSPVPEGVMHTWLDEPQSPASAVEAQGGNAANTSTRQRQQQQQQQQRQEPTLQKLADDVHKRRMRRIAVVLILASAMLSFASAVFSSTATSQREQIHQAMTFFVFPLIAATVTAAALPSRLPAEVSKVAVVGMFLSAAVMLHTAFAKYHASFGASPLERGIRTSVACTPVLLSWRSCADIWRTEGALFWPSIKRAIIGTSSFRLVAVLALRALCIDDPDALYPPGLVLHYALLVNAITILVAAGLTPRLRERIALLAGSSTVHLSAIPVVDKRLDATGAPVGASERASELASEPRRAPDSARAGGGRRSEGGEGDGTESLAADHRSDVSGVSGVLSNASGVLSIAATTRVRRQTDGSDLASAHPFCVLDAPPAEAVKWVTSLPSMNGLPYRPHPALTFHEVSFRVDGKWYNLGVTEVRTSDTRPGIGAGPPLRGPDTYSFRQKETAARRIRRADGSEHVATHMVVAQSVEARKRIATTIILKSVCDGQVTRLSIDGAFVTSHTSMP
jgi:hypothetical protein